MLNKKSDNELVKLLKAGNAKAYEEAMNRFAQKVYNLAFSISRSNEDAEEITQDVFVTLHKKIRDFQGKSALSSWIYRITANSAFMKLRQRKRHTAIPLEDVLVTTEERCSEARSDVSDLGFISSRHELQQVLQQAVDKLPDEYRTIFVLRDVDGLSNEEVGEMLQLSVPAIKSRLHRSRLMLRKRLEKFHEDYMNSRFISYGPRIRAAQFEMQVQ